MAVRNIIAATTAAVAAGATNEFTSDGSAMITCFNAADNIDYGEVVGTVMKKNSDGSYSELYSRFDLAKKPVIVKLTGGQMALPLAGKGTYAFKKAVTSVAVAVDVEE